MNQLFDSTLKLLVLLVAVCVAIRLAYDAIHPALPFVGLLVLVIAGLRLYRWYRERW